MKNNRKSLWRMTAIVLITLLMLTLLSEGVYAKITVTPTPLGSGTPPATARISCCKDHRIDYTAVAASSSDPRVVQFKDLSKGKETYIRWDFGDGTSLEGTKITPALKNPVHKYKKTGFYITCMTIKCKGCTGKLWVHKNVVIK